MLKQRSPNGFPSATDFSLSTPNPPDRPFLPLSTGFSQAGATPPQDGQHYSDIGIENTFLATNLAANAPNTAPKLFDAQLINPNPPTPPTLPVYPSLAAPTNNHPYIQKALLTKIYNNLTTRSNVFAVWLTVGFFEVTDDTARPVKLGAEIGRAENRQIRHRMFAIVDRTGLSAYSFNSTAAIPAPAPATSAPATLILPPTKAAPYNTLTDLYPVDPRTGRTVIPQVGTTITIDQGVIDPVNGLLEENVVITAVNPPTLPNTPATFTATFTKPHNAGARISVLGNPGPWTRYDPRQDTAVVLHFSIIE
jgi:hypothetical protein